MLVLQTEVLSPKSCTRG